MSANAHREYPSETEKRPHSRNIAARLPFATLAGVTARGKGLDSWKARNGFMPYVRVLIVDANAATAHTLSEGLSQESCSCEVARTGSLALSAVERLACDIVICDVRMAGMGDMELLDRLKRIDPTLPVILLTATGTIREAV